MSVTEIIKKFKDSTAEEILEYVSRELTSAEGGFYTAEDADSEAVEGKFYLWDKDEIRKGLPSELQEIKNSLKDTELKWDDLFEYLGKKHTSYPKLIDEYYWITITLRFNPLIIENFVHDFYLNKYGQK